ncbi:hypothetical protein K438DRAFT_363522 [Mycena galopus ATCC 62051]|nr:hypothetical protein K438DRAFT_363522 [Mycena galopus ATCC 62051]
MFRHWPWDKFYSHAWEFSSHIVTGIMVYTQYRLVLTGVLVLDLVTCILTLIRILQSAFICVALVERHEFAPRLYIALLFVSGTWGLAVNLAYFMLWNDSLLQPVKALFAVSSVLRCFRADELRG